MKQETLSRSGRPEGPLIVIRELDFACDTAGAFFSFEKKVQKIELVDSKGQKYIRVTEYNCYAGANTRPEASLSESYYEIAENNIADLRLDNWREKADPVPAYFYRQCGNDPLF